MFQNNLLHLYKSYPPGKIVIVILLYVIGDHNKYSYSWELSAKILNYYTSNEFKIVLSVLPPAFYSNAKFLFNMIFPFPEKDVVKHYIK